jgi:hypothetical protein
MARLHNSVKTSAPRYHGRLFTGIHPRRLDCLLARLHANKSELLTALDRDLDIHIIMDNASSRREISC